MEKREGLIPYRLSWLWYFGLTFGIAFWDECLFINLGPVQLMVEAR